MNALSIGPLVLAADRASAVAGIMAFLLLTGLLAKKLDGSLGRWSSFALVAGLVAARVAHVALHWESFSADPLRILAVWQGGFYSPAGVAVAALLILPLLRGAVSRGAGLASLVAGLFVWHAATLLTGGVEAIPLPEQPLTTLSGESVLLDGFRGQPMVINLWASWCPPCRREMPMMVETAAASAGTTFVFANQGEAARRIRSFLGEERVDPPNLLLDGLGMLRQHYKVPSLPTTLFIGRDGKLVDAHGRVADEGRYALAKASRGDRIISRSRLNEATRRLEDELDWGGTEHLDEFGIFQRTTELQKLAEQAKCGDLAADVVLLESFLTYRQSSANKCRMKKRTDISRITAGRPAGTDHRVSSAVSSIGVTDLTKSVLQHHRSVLESAPAIFRSLTC